MAQYAYNYNDIYDDYIVQAAPDTAPEIREKAPQPELRRVGRTRKQVIIKNLKGYLIDLAKISLIVGAFSAVIYMAVSSGNNLNAAKKELDDVNAAYQLSLEQNNDLKLQIDKIIEDRKIPEYAEKELKLVKIPGDKMRVVDITPYQ